jgi:hypothetical protein
MAGPEVKVKVGADTTGLDRGLKTAESRLAMFAKVGAAAGVAAGAAGVAMIALTKASLANIDATTKQARSLGLTTSALQTMSLVAKEAGVQTGQLTSMLGLMQRNISELQDGTKKQTEAFAAMGLSIADLQGLTPDEQFARIATAMEGITDPTEKTAAAMEVFGRSGRAAINMLSGYGARAREAAEFNARFGISVRQDVAEGVERANDAVGRLGMVMEGLGNRMAGAVAPAIERVANGLITFAANVVGAKVTLEDFFGTLERAREMLGEDVFQKLVGNPDLIKDVAPQLERIANEVVDLALVADSAQRALEDMVFELSMIGEEGTAQEISDIADGLREADQQFKNNEISAEQFRERMDDAKKEAERLLEKLGDVDGARFGGVIGGLGSLITKLGEAVNVALELRRALPGTDPATLETVTEGDGSQIGFQPVAGPRVRPRSAPALLGEPDNRSRGGGGGGGKGLKDDLAQRLKILQEGLQTEAETVAAWYEEQNATLIDAKEREMLTEEQYRELRERLEQEHQDRLAGIRSAGNESAVAMALGAGEQILSAVGGMNKKALKMAKVFGAAQALVSTYQGAAEELKKGTFGFASAAAVIAKGLGFVAAIRGVSDSGGGGRGGGGSSGGATAAQPAPMPTQTFIIDAPGFNLESLVMNINEASRRGYRLDLRQA